MNASWLGLIRGLGVVLLSAVLTYLGDVSHLGAFSPYIAGIVSALALALENAIESNTGKALFGAVRSPMTLGSRK